MTLFNIKSASQKLEKPRTFSGHVWSGIDIWLSYRGGNAMQDFEAMPECIENVLYSIFNKFSNASFWGQQIMFNGDITVATGPVIEADSNWRRLVTATLVHEVSI